MFLPRGTPCANHRARPSIQKHGNCATMHHVNFMVHCIVRVDFWDLCLQVSVLSAWCMCILDIAIIGSAGPQQSLEAAARPANAALQTFWQELAAIRELSLFGTHAFLVLGAAACFPLEGDSVQRRLFIRQCYRELMDILDAHFASGGRSFIITGNPGKGKEALSSMRVLPLASIISCLTDCRHWEKPLCVLSHVAAGAKQSDRCLGQAGQGADHVLRQRSFSGAPHSLWRCPSGPSDMVGLFHPRCLLLDQQSWLPFLDGNSVERGEAGLALQFRWVMMSLMLSAGIWWMGTNPRSWKQGQCWSPHQTTASGG